MKTAKWLNILIIVMIATLLNACENLEPSDIQNESAKYLVIQYSGGVVVHYWLATEGTTYQSGTSWRLPGEKEGIESWGEVTIIPFNGKSADEVLAEYKLK